MANQNRNQHNQFRHDDQDWDRNRNRYGNDYNDYSNSQGGYGQSNYNQDYDRDFNRSGNRNYGNQYNNPYEGGYNDNRSQNENRQQSGGYNQGRRDDAYSTSQGGMYGYGAGGWQPNSGQQQQNYGSGYNDYQNRGYGSNFNDDDRRYGNRQGRQNQQNRDWWERTSDEIASWFGDQDAERRRRVDKTTGPHRGKGPRGYKRSDDRIKDDINDRLSDDPYVDASDIDVKVTNGEVVLSGSVDTKEAKRRAEDLAEAVSGVSNVENHIRVSRTVTSAGAAGVVGSTNTANTNIREGNREHNDDDTNSNERKKSSWL